MFFATFALNWHKQAWANCWSKNTDRTLIDDASDIKVHATPIFVLLPVSYVVPCISPEMFPATKEAAGDISNWSWPWRYVHPWLCGEIRGVCRVACGIGIRSTSIWTFVDGPSHQECRLHDETCSYADWLRKKTHYLLQWSFVYISLMNMSRHPEHHNWLLCF